MKLIKTWLRNQLKQTSHENLLYITTDSMKEGLDNIVFEHFVDELKHRNLDIRMNLWLVPVFLAISMEVGISTGINTAKILFYVS